jgi:hypothetical protein
MPIRQTSVDLFGGSDQRDILAFQGALSRADRAGRRSPAGAAVRAY